MFISKLKICLLSIGLFFVCTYTFANNRLIIKYKLTPQQAKVVSASKLSTKQINAMLEQPLSTSQVSKLSKAAGMVVKDSHGIGTGAHVIFLEKDVTDSELKSIITKMSQDPSVEYVVEDRKVKHTVAANPNIQWDMTINPAFAPVPTWVGDNFVNAWDLIINTPGAVSPGNGVVVAVIDEGYTPHPNILSRLQLLAPGSESYGYQFISDCRISGQCPASQTVNTTIPPQPNGLDLGDYVSQQDINSSSGFFSQGCLQPTSSWHGTHVTGITVATGYTGGSESLVAGGAWGAKVVPVRVLGKCGGYTSDVIAGTAWSVGLSSIPNPNPKAQVLNMSFGGEGACDAATQASINQAVATGAIVVAAAGNSSMNVTSFTPAGCQNVISVSAKGPNNALAYYSDIGATTITASGGNDQVCSGTLCQIYSTVWGSSQVYESTNSGTYAFYEGTSMVAPHVSAAVADIVSFLAAQSKQSSLAIVEQILLNSASSYTNCSSSGCASQFTLNAGGAIAYITGGTNIFTPNPSKITFAQVNAPQTVIFTNTGTFDTISSVTVSAGFTNNTGSSTCASGLVLNPASTCTVIVSVASGTVSGTTGSIRLTDTKGNVLSTVNLSFNSNTSTPPSPGGGGGGGGGGCTATTNGDDFGLLLLLLSVILYTYYRRRVLTLKKVN